MYHPDPLKISAGGEKTRRTRAPQRSRGASADAVPAVGQVAAEEIDPGEFAVHHLPDPPLDRPPPGPFGEDDPRGRHRLVDRFADLAHHPDVDLADPFDLLVHLLR